MRSLLTQGFWHYASVEDVQAISYNVSEVCDKEHLWTPIHWAAAYSPKPEVIKILVEAGMSVNVTDAYGMTPIHYAAENNPNPEMITALLNAGADIEAIDNMWWTVLHHAAGANVAPVVEYLIDFLGIASCLAITEEGYTVWDLAVHNQNLEHSKALETIRDVQLSYGEAK